MRKIQAIILACVLGGCGGSGFDVASEGETGSESDASKVDSVALDGAGNDVSTPIGDAGADAADACVNDTGSPPGSAFKVSTCLVGKCCHPSVDTTHLYGGCYMPRPDEPDWASCYLVEAGPSHGVTCPVACLK